MQTNSSAVKTFRGHGNDFKQTAQLRKQRRKAKASSGRIGWHGGKGSTAAEKQNKCAKKYSTCNVVLQGEENRTEENRDSIKKGLILKTTKRISERNRENEE